MVSESKMFELVGEKVGFLTSYAFFTLMMYLLLGYLGRIPESWSLMHIAAITLLITILGSLFRWVIR